MYFVDILPSLSASTRGLLHEGRDLVPQYLIRCQAKEDAKEIYVEWMDGFELGISKRQTSAQLQKEAGNGHLGMEDTSSEGMRPLSWEGWKLRLGDG